MLAAIDHVQLAMPAGEEAAAEAFYCGVLGLERVPKPPNLEKRGGCWFERPDGAVRVHLGVEADFRPAKKAHPAFLVDDLDALVEKVGDGFTPDHELEGVTRGYVEDPFGNRIELIQA